MSRQACVSRIVVVAVLALAAACSGGNPAIPDAAPDVAGTCSASAQCKVPKPVCDVGAGTCVECTQTENACEVTAPVCGTDNRCRGCTSHSECALSGVCLPEGRCAPANQVAYLDPMGPSNTACSLATPCPKIVAALATGKAILKFTGTFDEPILVQGGRKLLFLAEPGTVLTQTITDDAVLTVRGDNTSVDLYDLTLRNAPNSVTGFGLAVPAASGAPSIRLTRVTVSNNTAGGISVAGASLIVHRSKIVDNVGGGVSITGGLFELTNNIIANNGATASVFGGVSLAQVAAGGEHRVDFNTITANRGPAGTHTGIACSEIFTPLAFANNIIYDNVASAGGAQVGGHVECFTSYSDIGPQPAIGMGNLNVDPMFQNAAQGDFHLRPGSPAKDKADPAAMLEDDIDGDHRPQGAARDMGADETP